MAPKYLYRSPLPDLVLPEIQDITTTLFERPEVDKSAPALIDGLTGRSWTYGELIDRYERLARSLASKYAAKEGEVICYLTPNNMELVAFLYATFRTGAAVSGVSTLYVPAEISFQVSDTGAKTVVVHPDYLGRLEEAIKKFSLNVSIILTAPKAGASYPTIEDLTQAGSQLPPLPRVQPRKDLGERVAEIFYSSGTTGRAKGVVQLHRNVIAAFLGVTAMETGWMIPGKDIQLNVLALNHIYGCNKVLHPSFYGRITTILLPTYTLATFMEAIQRFKVTRLAIVPPQAIALLKDPLVDKYDYSSVRFITCGAAVLGREMHEALYNKFRVLTKQGYGSMCSFAWNFFL